MPDRDRPATEGDREWREQTQATNDLARQLRPPHDDETERAAPTPAEPNEPDEPDK